VGDRVPRAGAWLFLEALEREFVGAGFAIEEFYSDVAGSLFDPEGAEFAVVARKVAA